MSGLISFVSVLLTYALAKNLFPAQENIRKFVLVPLFFGPSRTVHSYIPKVMSEKKNIQLNPVLEQKSDSISISGTNKYY